MMSRHRSTGSTSCSSTSDIILGLDECRGQSRFTYVPVGWEGDLAARARTLLRGVIGPRVCVSGQAVDMKLSMREHVVFSSEGR